MLTDEHTQKLGLLNHTLKIANEALYPSSQGRNDWMKEIDVGPVDPKPGDLLFNEEELSPGVNQLGFEWLVKNSTPNNRGMSIAHRSHEPSGVIQGIPRFWGQDDFGQDRHDPRQHLPPVDPSGNPIPGLTPTHKEIDEDNYPCNQINPQNYNKDGMLISNNYQPYDAAMDDLRLRRKQGKVSDNQWIKELQIINRTLYPKGV